MQAIDTFSAYPAPSWRHVPPLKERLRRYDRDDTPLMRALRSLVQGLTRRLLRQYHGFEIEGREHLPTEGSFVLVANHCSHLDAACLLAAIPWSRRHRAFSAAAADYFFEHTLSAVGSVVGVNALPFDRRGGGAELEKIPSVDRLASRFHGGPPCEPPSFTTSSPGCRGS